jgi:flagellar M-ring protein FliF
MTLLGLDKTDLMRLAELVVLAIVALLVLLLVVRPLLGRILAMPSVAPANVALAGPADQLALPAGAAAALAIPGPAQPQLPGMPTMPSASDAEAIAAEIDQMIDLNQVEGRVRASSIKKISELVDQHPEQAVNLIRQWVYQEQ